MRRRNLETPFAAFGLFVASAVVSLPSGCGNDGGTRPFGSGAAAEVDRDGGTSADGDGSPGVLGRGAAPGPAVEVPPGTGGSGTTASGGRSGSGGAMGAATASGGSPGSGGRPATATGGSASPGSGGKVTTGGATGSGGKPTVGSGGASVGGATAVGTGGSGGAATGGRAASGGAVGSGGMAMPASGGKPGMAGMSGSAATGGAAGSQTTAECLNYIAEYATELPKARQCNGGLLDDGMKGEGKVCSKLVPAQLGCGSGCNTYVDDARKLDSIREKWTKDRCVDPPCASSPACLPPVSAVCTPLLNTCTDVL